MYDAVSPSTNAKSTMALVADVRKESPEKADILEKGLADLKKAKGNAAEIAKGILAKLG